MTRNRIFAFVKLTVFLIVLVFIVRAVVDAREEFAKQQFSLRNLQPAWILLASVAYLIGVFPMAMFWHRLLHAMGKRPTLLPTLRAHYIGQLGKYVPGKAMVLALRYGLIRRCGIDFTTGALSIFAETMTMMSVGAVLAALILSVEFRDRTDLLLLTIAMMVIVGMPTWPPILRYGLRWLHRRRFGHDIDPASTSRVTLRVLLPGWLAVAVGWLFLGLSMWATLRGLDLPTTRDVPITKIPQITATLAVAVVAGFLSMLPGGVGVREWALNEMMAKPYGEVAAIVAPLLLRLTWLVSELAISGILYFVVSASDSEDASSV